MRINDVGIFQNTLAMGARALLEASERTCPQTVAAVADLFQKLDATQSLLFVTGVGKSGHVAQKITSTFNSLGLRSVFLHPVEALHGDLGPVRPTDGVLMISKSGGTEELLRLDPFLPCPREHKVGLLGDPHSELARRCGIVFDSSIAQEAGLNHLAPTTSSTLAQAMGDAMAIVFEHMKNLSREDFALNHPGGSLGKLLRARVGHLVWPPQRCPMLGPMATLKQVILEMTEKSVGGCAVVEEGPQGLWLKGLIVEGDIRRAFTKEGTSLSTPACDIMTTSPVTIGPEAMASQAVEMMELREGPINILPVAQDGIFLGLIRLHDLIREGFFPKHSTQIPGQKGPPPHPFPTADKT